MTRTALLAALAGLAAGAATAQGTSASGYGCNGLETADPMAFIEGEDGIFYRLNLNMRMNHPLSRQAAEMIGTLSDALAEKGTTLVYVPVPTKSLAIPGSLPAGVARYGFDIDVADQAYAAYLDRFEEAGVPVVDTVAAMRAAEGGEPAFMPSDFHWSTTGSHAVAEAVADVLRGQPAYDDVTQTDFETEAVGMVDIISAMRRRIQPYCADSLPRARTQGFETTAASGGGDVEGGIFASEESAPPIALIGTSMSNEEAFHFEGFLADAADAQVANYAITGGNQFGSLTSYLLSEDFQDAPPDFLVWENPIYNNLGEFGELPLLELIAAARDDCAPLDTETTEDGGLAATLPENGLGPADAIRADTGAADGRHAHFSFETDDGLILESTITRPDRYAPTRWFYQAVAPLRRTDFTRVRVDLDRPAQDGASLAICNTESIQS